MEFVRCDEEKIREGLTMKADNNFVATLESLIDQYEKIVLQSACTEKTKRTYVLHSRNFVRWVKSDFEPGSTLKGGPESLR